MDIQSPVENSKTEEERRKKKGKEGKGKGRRPLAKTRRGGDPVHASVVTISKGISEGGTGERRGTVPPATPNHVRLWHCSKRTVRVLRGAHP